MLKVRSILFFLLSLGILFFDFYSDGLRVAGEYFSDPHQITLESFIIGRIVKSGRDGVFSAGGLTGLAGPDAKPPDTESPNYRFQSQAYLDSLPFQTYSIYKSQIGAQGMVYSALNGILPFPPADRLSIFHAIASLLSALMLSLVILWFYREFGITVATVVLAGTALSQWLVIFAHSLWWSTWAFFLPMAALMFYLNRLPAAENFSLKRFGGLIFIVVMVKCFFNGYEYITTALIMMVVPFVYFCIRRGTGLRLFWKGLGASIAASSLAILVSLAILCLQIATVEGSFWRGVDHILFSFFRRSYANPQDFPAGYAASLEANPIDVVATYLRGIYLDLNYYFSVSSDFVKNFFFQTRYLYLVVLFAAASALLLYLVRKNTPDIRRRALALAAATGFSILAPLSWLILFKAHSYVHTFMNNIVWQMPFTIFGFAVCGLVIQTLLAPKVKNGSPGPRRSRTSPPNSV
jgi:hypothetical protein